MQPYFPSQIDPINAVIFDLDGVLMDSEWIAFIVWQEVVRELGGSLPDATFVRMTGTSMEESARLVMEASAVQFEVKPVTDDVWQRIVQRLRTNVTPMVGARELVEQLAARGIPLAIASNSLSWYIDDALHGLKLEQYFPIRVSVDQVAQGKPSPDVYLEAARQIGAAPERCLAVEDSPIGFQAAVSAGMRVIAVPHPLVGRNGYDSALRVYHSLADALPELAELMGW